MSRAALNDRRARLPLAAIVVAAAFVVCASADARAQEEVRLSEEEAEKLVVEKPEPAYPAIAMAARASGVVRVELKVTETGSVASARALSGHPLLQAAAQSAAKHRKYRPHLVGGKPTAFVTTADIVFKLDGAPAPSKAEYERDAEISRQYFKEAGKCRALAESESWDEAVNVCGSAARLAEQFGGGRELEKMGAFQDYGRALMWQGRYVEATEQYKRALDAVAPVIKETDAELASIYGNLAFSYHVRRQYLVAFEYYRKAEKTYMLAHANIGKDDPDGDAELRFQERYLKALVSLIELHRMAAEEAGAADELADIERLMKSLPKTPR